MKCEIGYTDGFLLHIIRIMYADQVLSIGERPWTVSNQYHLPFPILYGLLFFFSQPFPPFIITIPFFPHFFRISLIFSIYYLVTSSILTPLTTPVTNVTIITTDQRLLLLLFLYYLVLLYTCVILMLNFSKSESISSDMFSLVILQYNLFPALM